MPLHFTQEGFAGSVWNPAGRGAIIIVVVGIVPAAVVPTIVVVVYVVAGIDDVYVVPDIGTVVAACSFP